MYGQTFAPADIGVIAFLIVLEGILSVDNALVLALLAKPLPKKLQARALTYGLVGAFVFRFVAIGSAQFLLQWRIVKLLGGAYLLWVALKYLIDKRSGKHDTDTSDLDAPMTKGSPNHPGFWHTVFVIELTDIAFAVDSIIAAVGVVGHPPVGHVGPHPKLWVVVTGGILGVVLMRFAATMFIRLLERFPRFESSAYLLVTTIGLKLVVDWGFNSVEHPHRLDFHDTGNPAFWVFWGTMLVSFLFGFLPKNRQKQA